MFVINSNALSSPPPSPPPSAPPGPAPSRAPVPNLVSIRAPPPSPSLSGTVNQSHPGQETGPRAAPSAVAEQRSGAQLHAQGDPPGPAPLPVRRGPDTPHLNPTPQDAPLFYLHFSLPQEAIACPSTEPRARKLQWVRGMEGGGCGWARGKRGPPVPIVTKRLSYIESTLVPKPLPPLPPPPDGTRSSDRSR